MVCINLCDAVKGCETVTALAFDTETNILTYTDEAGAEVSYDLSAMLAGYQPLDADLTAIAALTTTAFGRELLTMADAAAGRTALELGSAALESAAAFEPAGSVAAEAAIRSAADGALDGRLDTIEALGPLATDAELAAHVGAADPHPIYLTSAEAGAAFDPIGAAAVAVGAHEADTTAVHGIADTSTLVTTATAEELIRDAIAAALVEGAGITITVNDAGDTITIATTALLPTLADAKGDILAASAADTIIRLAVGADGQTLVADAAQAAGLAWGSMVDVQLFSSSGMWAKVDGASLVGGLLWGAGGSGASGAKGADGIARVGGGGGSGGAVTMFLTPASSFGDTESVLIGAGPLGGASQTTDSTIGLVGVGGGATSFAGRWRAAGGTGGTAGGFAAGGNGGVAVAGVPNAAGFTSILGASANTAGTSGSQPGVAVGPVGGSGGSGAGITTANNASPGGLGGHVGSASASAHIPQIAGGTVGTLGGGTGGDGNAGTLGETGGSGGGGGGSSTTGNAGAGGNGGYPGGAGGGGGAAKNAVGNSGAGGKGADGAAMIWQWR